MFDFFINAFQIFLAYLKILLGLPLVYGLAVVCFAALFIAGIIALLILLAAFGVAAIFIAPVWYLGGPIIKRFAWAMYLWSRWANRNWRWFLFPPMTTVIWWVPGVLFVPIVGSLFTSVLQTHYLLGLTIGLTFYDIGLLWLLQIGANYDVDRQYARLRKVSEEEGGR